MIGIEREMGGGEASRAGRRARLKPLHRTKHGDGRSVGGMGEAKASTRNQAWRRVDCKITGSDGNIINYYYLCGYREKSFIKN